MWLQVDKVSTSIYIFSYYFCLKYKNFISTMWSTSLEAFSFQMILIWDFHKDKYTNFRLRYNFILLLRVIMFLKSSFPFWNDTSVLLTLNYYLNNVKAMGRGWLKNSWCNRVACQNTFRVTYRMTLDVCQPNKN